MTRVVEGCSGGSKSMSLWRLLVGEAPFGAFGRLVPLSCIVWARGPGPPAKLFIVLRCPPPLASELRGPLFCLY